MSKNTILNTYNFVSTSNRQSQLDSNQYELIIRQQPNQARLCSSKERDRRPVDPPPIIQLKVNGYGDEAQNFLQSPYYFMCANLVHPTDNSESFTISPRYLAGTVVSSLHKLKDIDNKDGGFFVFGDISVRVEGRYRLRFSLFEIIRNEVVHLKSVISGVFTVYSSKTFPGMSESTFLSRSFSDQGVRIRIRKEHRIQMKRPHRQSDNVDDDDNIDDDGIQDNTVKRKRSNSQTTPIEMFDNPHPPHPSNPHHPHPPLLPHNTSYPSYPSYPPHSPRSQHSSYPYPQRQGGGSLSYPPLGYPQQQQHLHYNIPPPPPPPPPPQRQYSYYEDSEYGSSARDGHMLSSSSYYYGHDEQSMLNKRPRLSNEMPYDYRTTPMNHYHNTSHPPSHPPSHPHTHPHPHPHSHPHPHPPPPPLPPSSSSYNPVPRRTFSSTLPPLMEHQTSYTSSGINRHHSIDVLTSSSTDRYPVTTTQPEPFYRQQPSSSSSSLSSTTSSSSRLFPPKPPVRSRTLPLHMHRVNLSNTINNNDSNNNDVLHRDDHHDHHQLPTPQTSLDGKHNYNKKTLYPSSFLPLTPHSSSVDSYKNGNNDNSSSNSNNNLITPSYTQHFTLSPRPGPLQLPKSPNIDNNSITRTNSLPVMSSSSNSNNTPFLKDGDGDKFITSPQLLPEPDNGNSLPPPRLPPIAAFDLLINKDKEKRFQQREAATHHSYSMDDSLTYNGYGGGRVSSGGGGGGFNYQ